MWKYYVPWSLFVKHKFIKQKSVSNNLKVVIEGTNSMEQGPSWEACNHSTSQKSPAFIELKGSVLYSQKPATGPYSWPIWLPPQSYTLFLRFILILSFHLYLGLPSGLFASSCLTEVLYPFLIFLTHGTCPPVSSP